MAVNVKLSDIQHLISPEFYRELRESISEGNSVRSRPGSDPWSRLPKMPGAKVQKVCELPLHGQPGPWVVEIPKWQPALANRIIGLGPLKSQHLKNADKRVVYTYLLKAGVPRAVNVRRKLTMTLIRKRGQIEPDSDNVWKSVKDALTKIGAWVDDTREWSDTELCTDTHACMRSTILRLENIP